MWLMLVFCHNSLLYEVYFIFYSFDDAEGLLQNLLFGNKSLLEHMFEICATKTNCKLHPTVCTSCPIGHRYI